MRKAHTPIKPTHQPSHHSFLSTPRTLSKPLCLNSESPPKPLPSHKNPPIHNYYLTHSHTNATHTATHNPHHAFAILSHMHVNSHRHASFIACHQQSIDAVVAHRLSCITEKYGYVMKSIAMHYVMPDCRDTGVINEYEGVYAVYEVEYALAMIVHQIAAALNDIKIAFFQKFGGESIKGKNSFSQGMKHQSRKNVKITGLKIDPFVQKVSDRLFADLDTYSEGKVSRDSITQFLK